MPLGIGNLGGFTANAAVSGNVLRRNNGSRSRGSSSSSSSLVGLCHAALFRGSLGGCVAAQLVDVVDDARLLRELLRFARQLQVLKQVVLSGTKTDNKRANIHVPE